MHRGRVVARGRNHRMRCDVVIDCSWGEKLAAWFVDFLWNLIISYLVRYGVICMIMTCTERV